MVIKDKKVILLIVLGVGGILSMLYGIITPSKFKQEAAKEMSSVPAVSQNDTKDSAEVSTQPQHERPRSKYDKWGRNPFYQRQRITISGIMYDVRNSQVMINDEIVGIGADVGGNKVIDIRPNYCIISDGTSEFKLHLGESL
jgi:hypothetical protein